MIQVNFTQMIQVNAGPPAACHARLMKRLVLLLGGLSLLAGLAGGLARLGLPLPVPVGLVAWHGAIMLGGFLGTLIGVERAVALQRPVFLLGPLASGLATWMLAFNQPRLGAGLLVLSALNLSAATLAVYRRAPGRGEAIMLGGAGLWLAGNLLFWAGFAVAEVVPLWVSFLVLTIAAERLELSFARGSWTWMGLSLGLCVLGAAGTVFGWTPGGRLAGLGLASLALWLARYDLARRTVRGHGLTRYIAVALMLGYAWLGVGGLLALMGAPGALHAVLLGFVLAMIFAHAPLVLPAVAGFPRGCLQAAYGPLGVLQVSVTLRLAGDLGIPEVRLAGGLLTLLAIGWFGLRAALQVRSALRSDLGGERLCVLR